MFLILLAQTWILSTPPKVDAPPLAVPGVQSVQLAPDLPAVRFTFQSDRNEKTGRLQSGTLRKYVGDRLVSSERTQRVWSEAKRKWVKQAAKPVLRIAYAHW